MEQQQLKNIIEAVLMSAEKPLKVNEIEALFAGDLEMPTRDEIRAILKQLGEDFENRGFELKQVSSGYRIQVKQDYADWVGRLWEEKPARYTRALLETIALIAYRQPITRGEIEEVRGVSVSSNIIKTLMEREWIKVLGHKDVPGKPALYGTTKAFLDYFNLKSLDELPSLAEIKDLDQIHQELDLDIDNTEAANGDGDAADDESGADDTDEDRVTPINPVAEAEDEAASPEDEAGADEVDDDDSGEAAAAATDHEDEATLSEDETGSGEADDEDTLTAVADSAGDEDETASVDDDKVTAIAAAEESENDTPSSEDEVDSGEINEDSKVKTIAAVVDEVEAEEDYAEAEPQSAAS